MQKMERVNTGEIFPYENNPRNNDGAVEAVAESIRQCGYLQPIIVDEDMIILAGHTRYRAVTEVLDYDQVDVIIVPGLTEAQKTKYRLLDNKAGEFSSWDFDLLKEETKDLDFGFDFGLSSLFQTGENLKETTEKKKQDKAQPMLKKCNCPRCGAEWEE